MSVVFVPEKLRGQVEANQETLQRLLEENDQLIRCIVEYQNKGRAAECLQLQHILHRNLIYLATIAEASPSPSMEKTAVSEHKCLPGESMKGFALEEAAISKKPSLWE